MNAVAIKKGPLQTAKPHVSIWKKFLPYMYLLPAVLFVCIFLLYPVVFSLVISFTEWAGLKPPQLIGFENYVKLFHDTAFIGSITNTVIWVFATLLLPVLIGLLMAAGLNGIKGEKVLKSIFYLPYAISGAATGIIWSFIFEPTQGVLNTTLRLFHLQYLIKQWLITPGINTCAMIVASTWQVMGTNMILFLVGLQNIPTDVVEASTLDGANKRQVFFHVTLPLLRPVIMVVTTMAIVGSFKVFDIIWIMTQGGPYRSSETLAVTMYRESFILFHLGYGAAIAVILALISFVASWFYIRAMAKSEAIY